MTIDTRRHKFQFAFGLTGSMDPLTMLMDGKKLEGVTEVTTRIRSNDLNEVCVTFEPGHVVNDVEGELVVVDARPLLRRALEFVSQDRHHDMPAMRELAKELSALCD